jgi:hypothetical protein
MSNQTSSALKKSLTPAETQDIINKSSSSITSPKTESNESGSKIMNNMTNFGSTPSYSLRAMKRAEE